MNKMKIMKAIWSKENAVLLMFIGIVVHLGLVVLGPLDRIHLARFRLIAQQSMLLRKSS
jgi:hypothetical protein